jgi:hypothetical protein
MEVFVKTLSDMFPEMLIIATRCVCSDGTEFKIYNRDTHKYVVVVMNNFDKLDIIVDKIRQAVETLKDRNIY